MNETTSRQTKDDGEYDLNFKEIKEQADVRKVLSHCGLLEHLEARGDELVGWCPFGEEHGKKDSFSMNVEKKNFQCFSCKARGSILDFVAKLKNGTLREAAKIVLDMMGASGEKEEKKKSGGRPYGKNAEGEGRKAAIRESVVGEAGEDIPPVMSFSLASRLIIADKIKPEHLLVVVMDAVGIEWKKAKKD